MAKNRGKGVRKQFGKRVEAFVPLYPNYPPLYAHTQRFDSPNRVVDKLKLHMNNLGAAGLFSGVSSDVLPFRTECIYAAADLPDGMRFTAGYPDRSISEFKGVIKFTFVDIDTCRKFMSMVATLDSAGPTFDSYLCELDLDSARVNEFV